MAAWIGFAFGHFVGAAFRTDALNVGTLRLFPALLGAAATLAATAALTTTRGKKSKRTMG
ncbi:MAG: hypothetical protein SGJ24_14260 [Chloroflexota bacterium]|nr:hypothetical protein [Chloroflexota bacterium]